MKSYKVRERFGATKEKAQTVRSSSGSRARQRPGLFSLSGDGKTVWLVDELGWPPGDVLLYRPSCDGISNLVLQLEEKQRQIAEREQREYERRQEAERLERSYGEVW